MPRSTPTVQQIADHLGLSKFSVSRALAGKSGVSEATRARIVQAASALRAGAAPQGRQVLFVTQSGDGVSTELWMTMLHGAEREAARQGLTLIPREARHLGDLARLDPAVCGLVLATSSPDAIAAAARRARLPAVTAGYAAPLTPIDQVVGADWEAGIVVARFLAGLGHRSIGFVRGGGGLFGRRERWRGLCDGAAEVPGAHAHQIGYDEPAGFPEAFRALLASGVVPTALFCAHDGLAVTVVSELSRMGVRVPHDVSVVGFFDFSAATQIVPPLTTIRVPQEEIGVSLVRCLARRMEAGAERTPASRLTLISEFVERDSTAAPGSTGWAARFLRAAA